jgi:hypothetical protein
VVLSLEIKDPIVKSMIAEQPLQHLHQPVEVLEVLRHHLELGDKVDLVAAVLIMVQAVKETFHQLLQVKEMMEEMVLMQETVGLLAEAAEPMLLVQEEVVQEAMELVQQEQEETEQRIQ